jgi:3-methyladenine DNA glycosylase AlkD
VVDRALIAHVGRELAARADAGKASQMRAYMKSAMPFRGVQTPGVREASKAAFAAYPLDSFDDWRDTALALWRGTTFREDRTAAILLTGERRYAGYQTLDALPLYEEFVVTGAWWDFVDAVAGHRLGGLLRRYPRPMAKTMRAWSRSPDLWKRRSSIICQLTFKGETDLDLLYSCIDANRTDREFFIRKAIGWALRQYAWTDPAEVARYVAANRTRLSPLSVREALKNVRSRS